MRWKRTRLPHAADLCPRWIGRAAGVALLWLVLCPSVVSLAQAPLAAPSTPKHREAVLDVLVRGAELVRWRSGPIRVAIAPGAEQLRPDLERIVGDYRSALAGTTCSMELVAPGLEGDIDVLAGNANQLREARRALDPRWPDMTQWYSWRREAASKGGSRPGSFDTGAAGIYRAWVFLEENPTQPITPAVRFARLQERLGRVLFAASRDKDRELPAGILGATRRDHEIPDPVPMLTDFDRRLIRFVYAVPPEAVTPKGEVRSLLRKHWDATRP
jgi:hypothetical protein